MILDFSQISKMALDNFGDIVDDVIEQDINSIRVIIKDGSYLDIWRSLTLADKYSYHWERKAIDETIYRHDNAAHLKWKNILTFPKHFHDKTEENVRESYISDEPIDAIFEFLNFIRSKRKKYSDQFYRQGRGFRFYFCFHINSRKFHHFCFDLWTCSGRCKNSQTRVGDQS